MIDAIARELAITRYGLAESLHVPIAAVDETAISTYIGDVQKVLNGGSARKALLVHARPPPARDPRFPIWDIAGRTGMISPSPATGLSRGWRDRAKSSCPEQSLSSRDSIFGSAPSVAL